MMSKIYDMHSKDYKKTVIEYYFKYGSLRNTCHLFKCKKSSLYEWIVHDMSKDISFRYGRPNKYTKRVQKFIINYVNKNVIPTLKQISEIIKQKFNIKLSYATIHRILQKNDITRKKLVKKYFPAKKENIETDLLKNFYCTVRKYNYKKIICLDETSVYINMLPHYGRSKSGTQAIRKTNIYPYKKYNLIIAMKYNKVIGFELNKNSYETNKLCNFIDSHLNNYKDHLIIFDNAVFHKSKKVIDKLKLYKIHFLYIVPYHPENNPIERLFSQIKSYLNMANYQSFEEIQKGLKYIIQNNILKKHLESYIKTLY